MTISINRWQRYFAVAATFVILMAVFGYTPKKVDARPAPVYKTLTGAGRGPSGFAVSPRLSAIAQKDNRTQLAPDTASTSDNNAPIKEFLGGLPIPRSVVRQTNSLNFNLPQRSSNGRIIGPDAKVLDGAPAPGVDWGWAGLSQGLNRVWYGYGVYPPDTQGDIGPSHYIQVVNGQLAIWDITALQQWVPTPKTLFAGPIRTLWEGSGLSPCETSEDGDPIVVYDEYEDRWLVSQFEVSTGPDNYECIAISETGDPMGAWYLYQYDFPVMNDYPKFGVWHDAYYMSINQFNPGWAGQGVVAFDKAEMLAGDPGATMIYIDTMASCTGTEPECFLGGMLPADADGSTAPTGNGLFMQFDDDSWGYSGDQLQIWEMSPNWTTETATFTHLIDLATDPFDSDLCGYARNCLPQKDTAQGLAAISDRLMYRLQWRDFGTYKAMVVNHTVDVDSNEHAGIRWYELRDTGSGWEIYQQGDYAPDSAHRWMGSAAMDDVGNIALGYSVTSSTMHPGIRFTVHLVTDPLGVMRPETNLVTGAGSQTGTGARWGDYSMMSVYPQGSGGCDFVYTTEYLRGTTPAEWYTWIGMFHNESCYTGDLTTPDTTIDSNPTAPYNSASATFTFSGTDDMSVDSFECSLDGGDYEDCASPATYTGLDVGAHTFEVRAIDTSSNVDPTPAQFNWTVTALTTTVRSSGALDGWTLESTATSNVGGTFSASGPLRVGDDADKKQYRSILSFDTGAALPDGSTILSATLKLKRRVVNGSVSTLGRLFTDIRTPSFGTTALSKTDFQAAASMMRSTTAFTTGVTTYSAALKPAALAFISDTGITQFRLRFRKGDDGDAVADNIEFYSGDFSMLARRPALLITYLLP